MSQEINGLQPCSQEEADTRILEHLMDAVKSRHKQLMVRTVDTDIVILCVANFHNFTDIEHLWIALELERTFDTFQFTSL